jgi:hypothetical protein
MAKDKTEKLSFYLVVSEPFLNYHRGDHIVEPEAIKEALENGYEPHVRKVAA